MRKFRIIALVLTAVILISACSTNKTEHDANNMLEEEAMRFAISEGEKYYTEKVKSHQAFRSCEKPEVVSMEVLENKYFDVRCCVQYVSSSGGTASVKEVYYDLRLEYDEIGSRFVIIKQSWGGLVI